MNVNNYIVSKILEKYEGVDEVKYSELIAILDKEIYTKGICSYVLHCAKETCLKETGCIVFANLLRMLDARFCISKACEYMQFLQNNHEHIDDYEMLVK